MDLEVETTQSKTGSVEATGRMGWESSGIEEFAT